MLFLLPEFFLYISLRSTFEQICSQDNRTEIIRRRKELEDAAESWVPPTNPVFSEFINKWKSSLIVGGGWPHPGNFTNKMVVKYQLKTITSSPQPEAAQEPVYSSSHNRGDDNLNFNADP